MSRHTDLALAALAPAIWGSSYIVTTQMLPDGYPLTVAMLRALPTGILLMLITRRLPPLDWLGKLAVLGALNFSIFWAALFLAAYRLPGGVAATLGAIQPLIVLLLARAVLGSALHLRGLIAAIVGIFGVALLVLDPAAHPDPIGILAALGRSGVDGLRRGADAQMAAPRSGADLYRVATDRRGAVAVARRAGL